MKAWKEGNNITVDEEIGASTYQITLDDFKVLRWNGSNQIGLFDEKTGRTTKDIFSNVKDKDGNFYGSTIDEVFDALNALSENSIPDQTISYQIQDFPTGLNTNVPAGFRSVTIARLSGIVTVNTQNGLFELGGGSRPRGILIQGDNVGNVYGITPEITISGGTWEWIAQEVL